MLDATKCIIYLRKSRADSPEESVEEVLAKHETMLQELSVKQFGRQIPDDCIFREVVSGETIDERPEMRKVLSLIECPEIDAVIVVEPQRLSRGDLEDCGKIVNAFRYSGTKVVTMQMTYDLQNKMHRKFFEQELMRGNDYLEYTKEILLRGRVLSVQKGNYIGNIPPFGYDKAKIDGCPSLKPNDDADAVRLAFDMYVNQGKTYLQIARHFDSIGVKPMRGTVWDKSSIRAMLKNVHYVGLVKFGEHRTEKVYKGGELTKQRNTPNNAEDVIISQGKHQALVTQAIFDKAQEKMNNNPRAKWDAPLKNPLAGLLFCSTCGKAITYHPYKNARDRYECRTRNFCGSKSAYVDEVLEAVTLSLESECLPELEAHLRNNDGASASIQQKHVQKMQKELDDLIAQEEKQYDLLEKGIYSEEKFIERNKAIHMEMDSLKGKIFDAKKNVPKQVDYAAKIVTLKKAIAGLRDDSITVEFKNKLLKSIIKRIDYEYLGWEGKGKTQYRLHIKILI